MDIEIPTLNMKHRIRGMQRWKKDIQKAEAGDRVALLVSNFPDKRLNRFVVCEPGALLKLNCSLATVKTISFFKGSLSPTAKLHISVGFETIMATFQFLSGTHPSNEYEVVDELTKSVQYVLLSFEQPVYARTSSFYIASKLDTQEKGCRFAFYGEIVSALSDVHQVKRFRRKKKTGRIERVESSRSVICTSLFKKGTDITAFEGMEVRLSTGEVGIIEGAFGKSGKVRVSLKEELKASTTNDFHCAERLEVELHMKKYLHDGSLVSFIPE